MSQFEVLAESTPAFNDTEVFRFSSLVSDAKLALQNKNPETDEYNRLEIDQYPPTVSLLACSSKYGYYVAATMEGFVYGSTQVLRDTIKTLEKTTTGTLDDKTVVKVSQGPIRQLRITADQTQIVVAVAGGTILIYNAKDIAEKNENAQPARSFELGDDVLDLRPNPDALPNLAAVILNGNKCRIIDLVSGETKATIPNDDVTAICWSPKGKQLICGRESGHLEPFDEEGNSKSGSIPVPEDMEITDAFVLGVLWIQPNVFLVVYGNNDQGGDPGHLAYIVDRKSKVTGGIQYILLDDVTGVFGEERKPKMFMEVIPNFSSDMKYAAILAHSASSDISVVGQDENGDWATYILPENGIAAIPLSESSADTYPVGLAIDFSVTESLPPYDPSVDSEGVKPMPAMYYLNDEDQIGAYYCFQETLAKSGDQYVGMIEPQDIRAADTSAAPTTTTTPAKSEPSQPEPKPAATQTPAEAKPAFGQEAPKTESVPSGFASSPWGAALHQQPADDKGFHSLLSGQSSPATTTTTASSGAFGGAGGSSFTSFRNLGMSTNAAPTQAPKFGTTSTAPTFGSTSFGQAPTDAPLKQSFASLAKQTTPAPGKGGLFSSSSTPSFGSTSFGATPPAAPTTEGQSFASLAKQSTPGAFGTANEPQKFGQTTFGSAPATTGGFASLAKQPNAASKIPVPSAGSFGTKSTTPAFGSTSFGPATPAFGSTTSAGSTAPAFGSTTSVGSSAPAFGSTTSVGSTTPAFGTTSSVGSTTPAFGSTTPLGSKAPAFGSTTSVGSTTPAFGSSTPLGSTTPAFGSTTPLGSTPPADKPVIPEETKKAAEPTPTPTPSSSETAPEATDKKDTEQKAPEVKSEPAKEEPQEEKKPFFGSFAPTPKKEEEKSSFGFGGLSSALNSTETTSAPKLGQTTGLFGKPAIPSQKEEAPKSSLFGNLGSQATTKPAGSSFGGFGSQTTTSTPSKPTFSFGSISQEPKQDTLSNNVTTPLKSTAKPSSPLAKPSSPLAKPPQPAAVETKPAKPEIPKLTAEDGMAREFELAYHSINHELKKLSLNQDELEQRLQNQRKQSATAKGLQDLELELDHWRLGDAEDITSIVDKVSKKAKQLMPLFVDLEETLEYYKSDVGKLRTKEEVIKDMKEKEKDPQLKKELDKRPLDEQAAKKWERAKSRAKEYGELLNDLENKVHDAKQKSKLPSTSAYDAKFPSLYSLQVAIRDIEKDLKSKQEWLQEYEGRLARLRFNENHARAAKSSNRIAFVDDESSDEEVEEQRQEKEKGKEDQPYPPSVVDFTAKYLQRERFLDTLHHLQKSRQ